jgi:hypothetical protein
MKTKRWVVMVVLGLGLLLGREAQAFYNPSTGRWLSRDPIGEEGGINLYGFVHNNPTDNLDADGLRIYITCPKCGRSRPAGYNCSCGEGPPEYGTTVDIVLGTCAAIGLACTPIPGDEEIALAALGKKLEKCFDKCKNVRCKVALHGPHHSFPGVGKKCHIQITCWAKGQKGSGVNLRVPVPDCMCPKKK